MIYARNKLFNFKLINYPQNLYITSDDAINNLNNLIFIS